MPSPVAQGIGALAERLEQSDGDAPAPASVLPVAASGTSSERPPNTATEVPSGMDVHKPKPVHNWREFASEVGIIVLGVLIALAGEQAVESLSWAHEVRAERAALNSEAQDFLGAAAARVRQHPCLEREMRDLETVFERHERGQALGIRRRVGGPYALGGTSGTWQIALSSQALGHIPLKEKLAYGAAFQMFETYDRAVDAEGAQWASLNLLNHPQIINAGDWSALHQAYVNAESNMKQVNGLAEFILASDNLGLRPSPAPADFSQSLREECEPLVTP